MAADHMELDYETDAIIQRSLRTELGKDVTLLTVAHRLQTIMDSDKIVSGPCFIFEGLPNARTWFHTVGTRCWSHCELNGVFSAVIH